MAEKSKKIVSLDKQNRRVKIAAFELANPLVFEYFNTQVAEADYDETLLRALYIGTLAMREDRLAAFFAKTENELGTHLESLKAIFEMKNEVFYKTAVKGLAAEEDIVDFLTAFFARRGYADTAEPSGTTAGAIPLWLVEALDKAGAKKASFSKYGEAYKVFSKERTGVCCA